MTCEFWILPCCLCIIFWFDKLNGLWYKTSVTWKGYNNFYSTKSSSQDKQRVAIKNLYGSRFEKLNFLKSAKLLLTYIDSTYYNHLSIYLSIWMYLLRIYNVWYLRALPFWDESNHDIVFLCTSLKNCIENNIHVVWLSRLEYYHTSI